ncbi:MAG TPA: hypothetical protein DCQ06_09740 [Myxococcales bacterium]|nr:hypothetical protein [Myxococcales bacterium]HAN31865.1 hypothetical protein [Myxococcales bacterium]|tara:strand:- start:42 stop:926 length:885 start_codon:yes stop_codon:yes gene_type:complete
MVAAVCEYPLEATSPSHIPYVDANDPAQIEAHYKAKIPFVITGADINPHGIDSAHLRDNYGDLQVSCFSPSCTSQKIELEQMFERIAAGDKYRLRADIPLGRCLEGFFSARFFEKIRSFRRSLMDLVLHTLARKKWAVFLSTPGCKMSNHAHINSTFVIQLEGTKTWHLDFRNLADIEHKDLYPYDFLAEKRPTEEFSITMRPGNVLYLPAYWFHYTDTDTLSLSMHYIFAESMSYYLSPKIWPLFIYELIKRPFGMMRLALARDNEFGFGDKLKWLRSKSPKELAFLSQNDYS